MLLTRGELASRTGVSRETIRYYERNGLLPEPARSEAGYRLFPEANAQRIHFIKRAQSVGFSLDEIKTLLGLKYADDATCGEVRTIAADKAAQIERKIETLSAMRATLLALVEDCPGGENPISDCPILDHFTMMDRL